MELYTHWFIPCINFIMTEDPYEVKSGALTVIEELPPGMTRILTWMMRQHNIGLETKYQADCICAFLWKRLMFIDHVNFVMVFYVCLSMVYVSV